MARTSFFVFASLLLGAFDDAALAQTRPKLTHIRRMTEPLVPVDLDLATGVVTRRSRAQARASSPFNTCVSLNNLDMSGFVGIDSFGCEWYEQANKGFGHSGGKSTFMTAFLFAYCSSAQDLRSGGVGGSAVITFREGYTGPTGGIGSGRSGNVVATYNLSGLPAVTGNPGFFGSFKCYFMRVRTTTPAPMQTSPPATRYESGACIPDGPIGYGWRFADIGYAGSNFALAQTFPFLTCVQSCSGVGPAQSGVGDNLLDQYDCIGKPGGLLSTFTFGTTTTFTSFGMQIREAEAIESVGATFNGSGVNPVILTGTTPAAVLKARWKVFLDCSTNPTGGGPTNPAELAIFRISFKPALAAPIAGPFGEQLVSLTGSGRNLVKAHLGGVVSPGPPAGILIPYDLGLYNLSYVVQGYCGDDATGGSGPPFLSNGLAQTVGSH